MKFKVGDRIRFIGRHKYIPSEAYGEYGTIHLVDKYDTAVPYHVKLDKKINGECYYWATEEHLEAEEKEKMDKESTQEWKIVITSAGEKTTARLYMLGRVVRETTVRRYHKDEYSMEVAAKEAVNKLFRSQGFTGRAMFVGESTYDDGFTRGKIYQFTDGKCVDDENCTRPHDSATTLTGDDWYSSVFVKVVE